MLRGILLSVAVSALLPAASARAYDYNKVIIRGFDWKITSVPHFEIYHYGKGGENLLPYAEQYLARAYAKDTAVLPYTAGLPYPFFLYNNHNEFEQSNIVSIDEGTGGVTEALKNRLLVSHTGSQRELEYVITHEFTHELEFDYLYTGFWRSIRLVKSLFYPNWLMEGLSEYNAGGLDPATRETYMRDAATSGKLLPLEQLHNFNHVLPHQVTLAYKESELFMRYVADEYGEDKLPKLLESYRNNFDADSVLYDVLGANLDALDKRFREYLADKYAREVREKGLKEPEAYGKPLTKAGLYPGFDRAGIYLRDGRIAYLSDGRGSQEIFILDPATGKRELVYSITRGGRAEYLDYEGSGIAATDRALVFCGEEQQKDYIYSYDLKTKRTTRYDPGTETASSPALSPDGGTVYFAGMSDGARNIYSYELRTGALERLTTGAYDHTGPAVSPDGTYLVYSEERLNASGLPADVTVAGRPEYNLTKLDLLTRSETPLLSLPGDEKQAVFSPDGAKLFFTANPDNINDIYALDLKSGKTERLTSSAGGSFRPAVSPDGSKLMFSAFRRTEMHLYEAEISNLESQATHDTSLPFLTTNDAVPPALVDVSTSPVRAYRFRPGLDLFYPALFYSSLDGLYAATYFQASDFLGDHQLQAAAAIATGVEYYDYQVVYGFQKWRPQVFVGISGDEYFNDVDLKVKRRDDSQYILTQYPLDRYARVEFLLSTTARSERNIDIADSEVRTRENVAGLAYQYDVTQGPYLEATSGWGARAESEFSDRTWGGDYKYQNYAVTAWRFFPLGAEHALGWRLFAAGSYGEDAGWFYLGGLNRVRGYSQGLDLAGHKVLVSNLEWRFPLFKNVNYHMWYMFPDFFFKTMTMDLFVDSGLAWNNSEEFTNATITDWRGSYGFGFRQHTFILQTFPLLLNLQLARQMSSTAAAVYFSIGSNF